METVLICGPSLSDQGGVAQFIKNINPHFSLINIEYFSIGHCAGVNRFFKAIKDQFCFFTTIKKSDFKVVMLNPSLDAKSFVRDSLLLWQAKMHGCKVVVFWHGWDKKFEEKVEKYLKLFFLKTFGCADQTFVLAESFKIRLSCWGMATPVCLGVTCIHEDLIKNFNMADKVARIQKADVIKILYLARLEREKGVFETVNAFKLLVNKGYPVQLTVAGDGGIRDELEKYTKSLNFSPGQISFVGDVRGEVKKKVFIENDIYCFPSYFPEGLPISVVEAMSYGMPVVTRHVGGLKDFFKDKEMGEVVFGKSPEEICEKLENLISVRENLVEVGKNNHEYAKKQFLAEDVAKKIENVLVNYC